MYQVSYVCQRHMCETVVNVTTLSFSISAASTEGAGCCDSTGKRYTGQEKSIVSFSLIIQLLATSLSGGLIFQSLYLLFTFIS